MDRTVLCEVNAAGEPIRIFRTTRDSLALPAEQVREMTRAEAVTIIRRFAFARSQGQCEHCGRPITWNTFHLHEQTRRGKEGEVSRANCRAICPGCHIVRPDSAHGNRRWHRPALGDSND